MGKSAVDANINNQIFRNDFSQVIAMRRDLAEISPVRIKDVSADYPAGQLLAYNSSTGQYEKYSAAASGSKAATCILFETVTSDEFSATAGALARAIFGGYVYKNALTNYDAGSKSQIGASEFVIASGETIVKF